MIGALLALALAHPWNHRCPEAPGRQRVALAVGTQKVLTFGLIKATLVPLHAPVEVKLIGDTQVLVIGQQQGHGTVTVFDEAGAHEFDVVVSFGDIDDYICGICTEMPCGATTTVRFINDHIFVEGEAATLTEWLALRRLQAKYPKALVVLAHLDPHVIDQQLWAKNHQLWRAGYPETRFERVGNEVLLEGRQPEGAALEHFIELTDPMLAELRALMPFELQPLHGE